MRHREHHHAYYHNYKEQEHDVGRPGSRSGRAIWRPRPGPLGQQRVLEEANQKTTDDAAR